MPTPREKTPAVNAPVLFRLRELQATASQTVVPSAVAADPLTATQQRIDSPLVASAAAAGAVTNTASAAVAAPAAVVAATPVSPTVAPLSEATATQGTADGSAPVLTFFQRWRIELKNSVILLVAILLLWGAWLIGNQDTQPSPAGVATDGAVMVEADTLATAPMDGPGFYTVDDDHDHVAAVTPTASDDVVAPALPSPTADSIATAPPAPSLDPESLAETEIDSATETEVAGIVEPTLPPPTAENITQEPQVAAVVEPSGDLAVAASPAATSAPALAAPPISANPLASGANPPAGGANQPRMNHFVGNGQEVYYGDADYATLPQAADVATGSVGAVQSNPAAANTEFLSSPTPGMPTFDPQQAVTQAAALPPGHQYSATPHGIVNWARYFPNQDDGSVRAAAAALPGAVPNTQAAPGGNTGVAPIYR